MTAYRVSYSQTEYRTAFVEADTADEACELVRMGMHDDSDFDHADNTTINLVEVDE